MCGRVTFGGNIIQQYVTVFKNHNSKKKIFGLNPFDFYS